MRCTHKGCGQEFDEATNTDTSCSYHPGGPTFHEGLKSWSCCNDTNKPVLEFDQFMAIPPCTKGKHSAEEPETKPAPKAAASAPTAVNGGVEVYGAPKPKPEAVPSAQVPTTAAAPVPVPAEPKEEEQDDPDVPVPAGAKCKRLGCGAEWKGEESRGEVCVYHPQSPVFHEGSKGYLCCKRRVLEFSEFLKIKGCTEGKHLFVGKKDDGEKAEEVQVRVDHYQTPMEVHVSAYAKNITFTPTTLTLDLYLPENKHFKRTLQLYGAIDPEKSKFRILGSKVDVTLVKPKPASWPLLELPPAGTELPPGYGITFGVSGRTGTIGGKEVVLSVEEAARRA